jgi:hypothetical protein
MKGVLALLGHESPEHLYPTVPLATTLLLVVPVTWQRYAFWNTDNSRSRQKHRRQTVVVRTLFASGVGSVNPVEGTEAATGRALG